MNKSKRIAADTNVLLDYAKGAEFAQDCFATIRQRVSRASVVVLPTVIHELAFLVDHPDESPAARSAAAAALRSLIPVWRFQPVNCVPVGHGIVEETARKVIAADLLPAEEWNDALILSEAALVEADILLSSDRHLLDIDPASLKRVLERCDVAVPVIVSPRRIAKEFFR